MGPLRQSNFRPRTVQGEPATTGGTPAQLCTFRPAPASPITARRPQPPAARTRQLREGTQLSQPHGSACDAGARTLTCPSVPVPWLQSVPGSPGPRQLPFGPGMPPVSGRLCGAGHGGRGHHCPGFPPPFGAPAFASWTVLRPPGSEAFLTVGLPGTCPDPDGVVTFRTAETRPGWALPAPRGGGVPAAGS